MINSVVVAALVSGLIAFVGVLLNVMLQPYQESKVHRQEKIFSEMDKACSTLLKSFEQPPNEKAESLRSIKYTLCQYGTKNAIKIYSDLISQANVDYHEKSHKMSGYTAISYLTLLYIVIKKETYKQPIITEELLKSIYSDYYKIRKDFVPKYNAIVNKYHLRFSYLIHTKE